MTEYAPYPDLTPFLTSQEPPSRSPEPQDTAAHYRAPDPGDHPFTSRPAGPTESPYRIVPDTIVLGDTSCDTTYVIESRAPGRREWQIRPYTEHLGGRAFKHHHRRVRDLPGIFHMGTLMFSDLDAAQYCVSVLQDARYDRTEFRIREVVTTRTMRVVPSRRLSSGRTPRPAPPPRAPDFSTTVPASLGALGSWLGAQQTITPAPRA